MTLMMLYNSYITVYITVMTLMMLYNSVYNCYIDSHITVLYNCFVIFLDFHSTEQGQPLADSWSRGVD